MLYKSKTVILLEGNNVSEALRDVHAMMGEDCPYSYGLVNSADVIVVHKTAPPGSVAWVSRAFW